jgi:hypothetical protein
MTLQDKYRQSIQRTTQLPEEKDWRLEHHYCGCNWCKMGAPGFLSNCQLPRINLGACNYVRDTLRLAG